jgi:hypothetical protein
MMNKASLLHVRRVVTNERIRTLSPAMVTSFRPLLSVHPFSEEWNGT